MVASKVGADSSLLVSPVNTKLGCCRLDVAVDAAELAADELDPAAEEALSSTHGTATCLPDPKGLDEEIPVLDVLEVLPGVVLLVLEPKLPDKEITANSSRPDDGFRIVSLIVPIWVPELPVTSHLSIGCLSPPLGPFGPSR